MARNGNYLNTIRIVGLGFRVRAYWGKDFSCCGPRHGRAMANIFGAGLDATSLAHSDPRLKNLVVSFAMQDPDKFKKCWYCCHHLSSQRNKISRNCWQQLPITCAFRSKCLSPPICMKAEGIGNKTFPFPSCTSCQTPALCTVENSVPKGIP